MFPEGTPRAIDDLYSMVQAIFGSKSRDLLPVYCVVPWDSEKIGFIIGAEILHLLTKEGSYRDKLIVFSSSSNASKIPETYPEVFLPSNDYISTGKIIATYLKSDSPTFPQLLFSVRKSKPSWFTSKRIFAVVVVCNGLSDSELTEIFSWTKSNSIPNIVFLDEYLSVRRLELLSKLGFYSIGVDKDELSTPSEAEGFYSLSLKAHSINKVLNTKQVNMPGQIQHTFDNIRSILKLIAADAKGEEAEHIQFALRILLKKLESSPCKISMVERYFSGINYDVSLEAGISNIERAVDAYGGSGKSSMYRCISNLKNVVSSFLQTNPPKFSELINELNMATGRSESLAILFSNKANVLGFKESLKQTHYSHISDGIENGRICLLHPFSSPQDLKWDRVVIVSDFPQVPVLNAFMKLESSKAVLLHYQGEGIKTATDLVTAIEISKDNFNHNARKKEIERIKQGLPPVKLTYSRSKPMEEDQTIIGGETPQMPEIEVGYSSGSNGWRNIQSNQDSSDGNISRIIKILFTNSEELYVTEKSLIRVFTPNNTVDVKRASDLSTGDQVIAFKDSIVTDIYSAIRDELRKWNARALTNFVLVELWKDKLKQLMEELGISPIELLRMLSEKGSSIEGADTIRNWILGIEQGGVIGPRDKENLTRLIELFPGYFGQIPLMDLYRAITWVRGLPHRLISLSQKVILAKEFGEPKETEEDLLLSDIGQGLELKTVTLTTFEEE